MNGDIVGARLGMFGIVRLPTESSTVFVLIFSPSEVYDQTPESLYEIIMNMVSDAKFLPPHSRWILLLNVHSGVVQGTTGMLIKSLHHLIKQPFIGRCWNSMLGKLFLKTNLLTFD